jgi:hypothetical protein
MIRSQPAKSASLALGWMGEHASRCSALIWPRDLLVEQPGRVGLALLRGVQGNVLEHHLDTGGRRHVGDAGAHHAGAEHADLLRRVARIALRRDLPALISLSWNQKVPIMFFATWPVTSSVK